MRIVIFGLTISSSWGNGHATLWRSLVKAMVRRGHSVIFYEKDVPYYATTRDLDRLPDGATLRLYTEFTDIQQAAQSELDTADLALCTSFCPDGRNASELILASHAAIKAFYDLDTPVTLDELTTSGGVTYLPLHGLRDFDLVLSFTGGKALEELKIRLGARSACALYGSVDPNNHRPVEPLAEFRSTLSYLGTYAADRQDALRRLFVEPAELLPAETFLIGGAQYPEHFPWTRNMGFVQHVPPDLHPAFFSSGRATLNVTRGVMARYGYCPSGRLFEAAACGAVMLTDSWEGLGNFFQPGVEIIQVDSAADVVAALSLSDAELRRIAEAARARALAEHTGERRIQQLELICDAVLSGADGSIREEATLC